MYDLTLFFSKKIKWACVACPQVLELQINNSRGFIHRQLARDEDPACYLFCVLIFDSKILLQLIRLAVGFVTRGRVHASNTHRRFHYREYRWHNAEVDLRQADFCGKMTVIIAPGYDQGVSELICASFISFKVSNFHYWNEKYIGGTAICWDEIILSGFTSQVVGIVHKSRNWINVFELRLDYILSGYPS